MSSIRQPSRLELTRLTSVAEKLSGAWQHLSAQEVLSEILTGNAFIKNPALVSSFGADSAVLLHMASTLDANAQIVFLDTGFHFSETLSYRDRLTKAFGLTNVCTSSVDPIAVKRLDSQRRLHLSAPDSCCQLRKVSVLDRHLRMNDAWISGQRRDQASTRSSVSLVEVDVARGKLKFNPLAEWSQSDVASYKNRYSSCQITLWQQRDISPLAVCLVQASLRRGRMPARGGGVVNLNLSVDYTTVPISLRARSTLHDCCY